jgi:hypothetical protein
VARVLGRSPNVVQIVVNNRFRPGLADTISQLSQEGICVVDTADASFDEVVNRARIAATSASYYSYYDPVQRDALIEQAGARLGQPLDVSWQLNDRRGIFTPEDGDSLTGAELKAALDEALPRTEVRWGGKQPTFDGPLFLLVDSEPALSGHQAQEDGLPALYLVAWTDTHQFALAQTEALVREMEAVVVEAALDASAVAPHR